MRSGVKSVYFDDRIVLLGVIAHYATLHNRVKIVTPRGIVEEFDDDSIAENKRLCLACNKVELTKKQKTYCSQSCASSHRVVLGTDNRKVISPRNCKNPDCGKEFKPALNRTVFCSVACAKHVTKRQNIACKNPACSNIFRPHDKRSLYCSNLCANAVRAIKDKQCDNCKKLFKPKEKQQKFCCLKCYGESKRKDNDTR